MRKFFLLIISLIIFCFCFTEEPEWTWFNSMRSNNLAGVLNTAVDSLDNLYIAGIYRDSLISECDTLTTGDTYGDPFVAKVDPLGNIQWTRNLPNPTGHQNINKPSKILIDSMGNFYVMYTFSVNFSRNYYYKLLKFDPDGNSIWTKEFHTDTWLDFYMFDMHDDVIYMYVGAINSLTVDQYSYSGQVLDVFLTLDSSGQITHIERNSSVFINGCIKNTSNNIEFYGYFYNDFTLGNYNINNPGTHYFTIEYDASQGWSNLLTLDIDHSTSNLVTLNYMYPIGSRRIFLGCFQESIIFSTDTLVAMNSDVDDNLTDLFIAELDSLGNWTHVENFGSQYRDWCIYSKQDEDGDIYITGTFTDPTNPSTIYLDSLTATSTFRMGAYLTKLSPELEWEWVKIIDCDYSSRFYITLDSNDDLYLVGSYDGDAYFEDTYFPDQGNTMTIAKLEYEFVDNSCNESQSYNNISIANYPNPFNPETTIEYTLNKQSDVELTVYNIKGQKVKTLVSGTRDQGLQKVIWKGDDSNGHKVGSGVYFYKLRVDGRTEAIKKCVMLK